MDGTQMPLPGQKMKSEQDLNYGNEEITGRETKEFLHLQILGPQKTIVPSCVSRSAHLPTARKVIIRLFIGTSTQYYHILFFLSHSNIYSFWCRPSHTENYMLYTSYILILKSTLKVKISYGQIYPSTSLRKVWHWNSLRKSSMGHSPSIIGTDSRFFSWAFSWVNQLAWVWDPRYLKKNHI